MTELPLREKTFDTGTLHLNYAEVPANGAPLVLLHGATSRWQRYQKMISALVSHWHVYACDLRGHGKSGRDENRYHLTDYASDIIALLQNRIPEPAVLVGHSLGALTALAVAAFAPQNVRALVLLDPPLYLRNASVGTMPGARAWFQTVHDTTSRAQSYDDVVAAVRRMMPQASDAQVQMSAQTMFGVAPGATRILLNDELLQGFDLAQALEHIACPTLLLYGDWNAGAATRDEDAAFVRAHKPDTVIVKLAGANHQLPDERTEDVLREMNKFLK